MSSVAENVLKFKVVQLEGKLAIYENLITEIEQLKSIERSTLDIKSKLEKVIITWQGCIKENA